MMTRKEREVNLLEIRAQEAAQAGDIRSEIAIRKRLIKLWDELIAGVSAKEESSENARDHFAQN